MRRSALPLLMLLIAAALLLAACGAKHTSQTTKTTAKAPAKQAPQPVEIYSGLPLRGVRGSEGRAIEAGIEVAVHRPRATGPDILHIKYRSLDDTVNTSKKRRHPHWVLSLKQVAQNASKVAVNPRAVFYIGDLDSSATQISLQILNLAGIPQVAPGSGYVGLTRSFPDHVTAANEPGIYQTNPTHTATLLRMVPDDSVQATAIVKTIASLQSIANGCTHISIVSLSDTESKEIANLVYYEAEKTAKQYNVTPVSLPVNLVARSKTASVAAYKSSLKPGTIGCFVVAGRVEPMTIQVAEAIHAFSPGAFIIGSAGLCNPGWTNAHDGGVPAVVAARIRCVSSTLPASKYPGYNQFATFYRERYPHGKPSVYAFYGYTAAEWAISSITQLHRDATDRLDLLSTLIDGTHKDLLGQPFYTTGDINDPWFALYTVAANGNPTWSRTFTFRP